MKTLKKTSSIKKMLKGSTRRVKKGTENELQVLPPPTQKEEVME